MIDTARDCLIQKIFYSIQIIFSAHHLRGASPHLQFRVAEVVSSRQTESAHPLCSFKKNFFFTFLFTGTCPVLVSIVNRCG
jgi:hypothetical protein